MAHDRSKVLGLYLDIDYDDVYVAEHIPGRPTAYWRITEECYPPPHIVNADVRSIRIMRIEDGKEIAVIEIGADL